MPTGRRGILPPEASGWLLQGPKIGREARLIFEDAMNSRYNPKAFEKMAGIFLGIIHKKSPLLRRES